MCGICGSYGLSDEVVLKKMCATLTHRGPDDEGHYLGDDVMLGMRRLKVIDLETGNQPIFNEDRSVVVVYNGEIYNFREIRKELEEKNHTFRTHSDTESIVHLYEEYGDACVNKLRGMFAFALWDIKKKRLLIARDRIGIKPLYYYHNGNSIIFASEIKALLTHPGVSKEINYTALHNYLTYLYVPAPETIFRNIFKLLPGHQLVYENGSMVTKQYWDINRGDYGFSDLENWSEKELSEKVYALLQESIEKHMISDVSLGVFLSGGTDSASIVSIASELSSKPVKTFSIGFEDAYHNELDNAKLVAERYGTDHHEFVVTPPDIDLIEDIIGSFDEPFADSSAIPTYFVSKCAKEHVTVALSGDGGDEIFGGYGNYKADKICHYYRKLPGLLRDDLIPFFINSLQEKENPFSAGQQLKKLLEMSKMSPGAGHAFWLSVFNTDLKEKLDKTGFLRDLLPVDSLDCYQTYFDTVNTNDFLNRNIHVDIKTVLPDDYLTKVDRMSMLNSLEVRVPFLDHKLLEFGTAMPGKYKLNGLTSKYLLKKMMKNRLPNNIITGKKKGFSVPLSKWFKQDFSVLIDKYLSEEVIKKRGYFNYDTIAMLSNDHIRRRKDNSKYLWTLICLEIWHRKYMD